jgi:hypothetical protein
MWRRVPVGVIVYVLFTDSTLTIATVDGQDDRGFGYGVMADGVYTGSRAPYPTISWTCKAPGSTSTRQGRRIIDQQWNSRWPS